MPELTLHVADGDTPDCYVVANDGETCPAYRLSEGSALKGFKEVVYVHHPRGTRALTLADLGRLAASGRVYGPGPVLLPESVQVPSGDGAPVDGIDVAYIAEAPEATAQTAPSVGSFRVLVSVDGETPHRTTAYALVQDNEGGFDAEDIAAIAGMQPGAFVRLGGGAQPLVLVSRPMPRVRPAEDTREAKRRLFHARVNALHKLTGEVAKDIRARAVCAATTDRVYRASLPAAFRHSVTSSKLLDDPTASGTPRGTAELDDAISHVEDELHHAGFDFDADQTAYERRQAKRYGTASAWAGVSA